MALRIELGASVRLEEYERFPYLAAGVAALRETFEAVRGSLTGRAVWMVNSTAVGGGVAEMLPTLVGLLRDLGIAIEWVVIESADPAFFELTKRIHNLIHGAGEPALSAGSAELHERVNRENAEWLRERVRPGDLLVVHDPQPMPLARILRETVDLRAVWRCHIGLDAENEATRTAWEYLSPWAGAYERAVFSAPEYVPPLFADRARILHPAIDPLSEKNREMGVREAVGVLAGAGLVTFPDPAASFPEAPRIRRLRPDGSYGPATGDHDLRLLTRPVVLQVSRWDRLKGFTPLMEAFARMKRESDSPEAELARLVLSGPDPATVQDDPEGAAVLAELEARYRELVPEIQADVAVLATPQSGALVNALQRASTLVVQNSLREGFGLTITEAMWKGLPVLSNTRACGPRQQIRDGVEGRLIADPEDADELAGALAEILADGELRRSWGRNARRRVLDEFLVLTQAQKWLQLLAEME